MEQFLKDVSDYAAQVNLKPSTVIQRVGVSGDKWRRWQSRESSPTLHTVDRIMKFISDNPPPSRSDDQAAAA